MCFFNYIYVINVFIKKTEMKKIKKSIKKLEVKSLNKLEAKSIKGGNASPGYAFLLTKR